MSAQQEGEQGRIEVDSHRGPDDFLFYNFTDTKRGVGFQYAEPELLSIGEGRDTLAIVAVRRALASMPTVLRRHEVTTVATQLVTESRSKNPIHPVIAEQA